MRMLVSKKVRRIVSSLPGGLALTLVTASLTGIGLVVQIVRNTSGSSSTVNLTWLVKYVVLGLILGLVLLFFQTRLEYQRRAYDPTWILKYQEKFDGDDMKEKRRLAAKTLLEHKQDLSRIDDFEEQLDPIDDVLDFFEDIGFYVHGEQISQEVAHHHFYHWIRGYWYAARTYIETWRRKENARWDHLAELLNELDEIEGESLPLTAQELEVFLKQESAT